MHGVYIALNDLKITLKDRKVTMILLIMPMLLITVLGTALSSAFTPDAMTDLYRISIAIVEGEPANLLELEEFIPIDQIEKLQTTLSDLDINRITIEEVLQSEDIKNLISYEILDQNAALTKLKAKEISGIVYLPDQFANRYIMGKKSEIKIMTNTDSQMDKMILLAIFKGFSAQLSLPRIAANVVQEENIKEGLGSFSFSATGEDIKSLAIDKNISLQFYQRTEVGKRLITSKEYYTAAVAVMFMLFSAGYGLMNMLHDRDHFTLMRQLIASVSKFQMLLGKFLYTLFLCVIQLTILFAYGYVVMGIRLPSDLLAFVILIFAASFSMAGLSVLLCGIVKNQRGAVIFQSLIINILSLLGGSFIPIEVMPKIFRPLIDFTPNGRASRAFLHLIEDGQLSEISSSILMLLGFGTLCLLIGIHIFRPTER
ncbi:ABC-2 type transport system permease protein [Anaerosolibacter carboniphilus]|uniref:ABC-2 type transport system permease protein n=1 Tax=Anaerosolibacter carboniphilus TaxID=1417629 RepID=A0A841L4C0_9FIRM|nr:ABC transporter permease [Anaerosolibacter carboniphilus]MBB6217175.1 ABC-2 type transport system permease protein [Anaerosolibacter carboniphilus]